MPPEVRNRQNPGLSSSSYGRRAQETESDAAGLGTTDYGRWHGRIVSVFHGIGGFFKRIFGRGPSAARALRVYDAFCHDGQVQFSSPVQRSLHDYHIACAMAYHKICDLNEELDSNRMKLVLSGGAEEINEQVLTEVRKTVQNSTIELTYKYLSHDRRLPVGFLRRALIPALIQRTMTEYGVDATQAESTVMALINQEGLRKDSDITFERILEIKNGLRWHLSSSAVEPGKKVSRTPPSGKLDRNAPALTPPALAAPSATNYKLDDEDKAHIQNVVDNGGGIKLKNTDTRNRIKRYLLRNKKDAVLNTFAMVVGVIFTGLVTGGIGAAVSLFSYIVWCGAWSGGIELIRMTRAISALQKAEESSDYKLDVNDLGVLSEMDDRKFKTFLKSLRYVCSHETLTRIFNAYSELEKDALARLEMKEDESCLDAVIRLEEGTARYKYRRENMKDAFSLYKRFYTAAVTDVERMEKEWEPLLDKLWKGKFEHMAPEDRELLFNEAANDPRVIGRAYHFQTDQSDWLQEIFPKMAGQKKNGFISSTEGLEALERRLEEDMPDVELTQEEKLRFNSHTNRVANALILAKDGVRTYIKAWLKGAFKSTAVHGFKVGWHAVKGVPKIEISPYLPKPSVDGLIIFGFFFLADLLMIQYNQKINRERFEHISGEREGKSETWNWFQWRERTGREEMGTMRKLAKGELPDFVDQVIKLHDMHKEIVDEMRLQEKLSQVDPSARPFSHMDSYEAAVLILRRQYNQQIIAQMMAGAIGKYYESVMTKTAFWDQQMGHLIPPQKPL